MSGIDYTKQPQRSLNSLLRCDEEEGQDVDTVDDDNGNEEGHGGSSDQHVLLASVGETTSTLLGDAVLDQEQQEVTAALPVTSRPGAVHVHGPGHRPGNMSSNSSRNDGDDEAENAEASLFGSSEAAAASPRTGGIPEEFVATAQAIDVEYLRREALNTLQIESVEAQLVEVEEFRDDTQNRTLPSRRLMRMSVATACIFVFLILGLSLGVTLSKRRNANEGKENIVPCFEGPSSLRAAFIDYYLSKPKENESAAAKRYGWPIGTWCVSNVKDFSRVFYLGTKNTFNEDISLWNVSMATDMSHMFLEARAFNGDLSNWDTSQVKDMYSMFDKASSFEGDGIFKWNTSQVTDMSYMFHGAFSFKGNLSKWNASQVTNMGRMFYTALSFNGDISQWNTSQVTDMDSMFMQTAFNGNVSKWDTSQVTDMSRMFRMSPFNGDISQWDTSQVKYMREMFFHCNSFNGDISNWDTSQVLDMTYMFHKASAFNRDLSEWNVSRSYMLAMFLNATRFNQNLCPWGPKLEPPEDDGSFSYMFINTSCPNKGDPDFNATPRGPFCHECI